MFDFLSTSARMTLIPALPLAASLVTALLGRSFLRQHAHWPTVVGIGLSFLVSLSMFFEVRSQLPETHHEEHAPAHAMLQPVRFQQGAAPTTTEPAAKKTLGVEMLHTLWNWVTIEGAIDTPVKALPATGEASLPATLPFKIDVSLRSDPLTAIMLCMVTFIATLVAIYAAGYMHGDPGYWRFFSYVALFVFSMTMLVSVSNFLLLYVFWEAVGVCSYLLIGFWYEKPEAAAAGKKAFLVNRVGDFGFALGLFLIWSTYGTLNYHDADGIAGVFGQARLTSTVAPYLGGGVGLAICLLLMLGACGKSAQFPLHVWLPDAMEGPTPVSALIHAATMVTAGVYMVARCTPLFLASLQVPYVTGGVSIDAPTVVAVIGGFTALLAGLIGLTQTDLKRVLAYSTVSQLGYMFLALGAATLAGVTAGMFHLFTHAFFKALLFLGAGSVMHSMGHVIDMRYFSGLRRIMPITHKTFFVGSLALAGIVPFAGFWSKDAILAAIHARSGTEGVGIIYNVLYVASVITAGLTAFYTFRAFFMTFYGEERIPHEAGHHAHESPWPMTLPLVVLAVFAFGIGWYCERDHWFAHMLEQTPSLAYISQEHMPTALRGPFGEFHIEIAALSTLVALAGVALAAFLYLGDRTEVDYLSRVLRPFYQASYHKFWWDQIYTVIVIWPVKALAAVSYLIDRVLIDGFVDFCGYLPQLLGKTLRSLQTGLVQFYALAMVMALAVLLLTLIWPGT
jgi:NADH-quinone oxidoreductase subunit L